MNTLSGGQMQRLKFALAIVGDPDLVFLDEPTSALDPYSRRGVWECVGRLRERKKTILLTTHNMEEAAELSDRVLILQDGRLRPSALGTCTGRAWAVKATACRRGRLGDVMGSRPRSPARDTG